MSEHIDEEIIDDNNEKLNKCCICLDNITNIKTIKFGCNHQFHSNCILDWIKRDNNRCPLCREIIIDESLFKVYREANTNNMSYYHVTYYTKLGYFITEVIPWFLIIVLMLMYLCGSNSLLYKYDLSSYNISENYQQFNNKIMDTLLHTFNNISKTSESTIIIGISQFIGSIILSLFIIVSGHFEIMLRLIMIINNIVQ
jgi:hypothetical protein